MEDHLLSRASGLLQTQRNVLSMAFDGIIVSDHAGRHVDGAIASLDALEKIVDAFGEQIYVMFDFGAVRVILLRRWLWLRGLFLWGGFGFGD